MITMRSWSRGAPSPRLLAAAAAATPRSIIYAPAKNVRGHQKLVIVNDTR